MQFTDMMGMRPTSGKPVETTRMEPVIFILDSPESLGQFANSTLHEGVNVKTKYDIEEIERLLSHLKECKGISTLIVSVELSLEEFSKLIAVCQEKSGLTDLILKNVGFGDEGVEITCLLLKSSKSIQKLELQNNKITMKGIDVLLEFLKTNTTLREVDISQNNIRNGDLEEICNKIADLKQLVFF